LDSIAANLAGRPVVIGDGVAGLMTALNLVPQPVIVLAKGRLAQAPPAPGRRAVSLPPWARR
jgi:aspartate oxidase